MSAPAPTRRDRAGAATSTTCPGWRRRCGARSRRSTAHALLIHGPGGVGQFELALALAKGWLCEASDRPLVDRPCGRCASCKLHAARSHPDLLVLVPEALRESLGWDVGGNEGEEAGEGGKRKPSKEIRVEAVRAAIALRDDDLGARPRQGRRRPSGRADERRRRERLPEDARGARGRRALPALLGRARQPAADDPQPLPAGRAAGAADGRRRSLAGARRRRPARACCSPPAAASRSDALDLAERGIDAAAWLALPRRIAAGDATALQGWGLPAAIDALQKICHDAAALACGGAPRYFPQERCRRAAPISTRCCAGRASWRASPPRPSTPGASTWRSKAWSDRAGKR